MRPSYSRFMARFIGWLVATPLLLLFVLFAVSNRQDVMLGLWPLPATLTVPLYLLLLGILFSALLVGLFLGWLGQHGVRVRSRQNQREIARLRGMIASAPAVTTGSTTATLITARTVPTALPGDLVN